MRGPNTKTNNIISRGEQPALVPLPRREGKVDEAYFEGLKKFYRKCNKENMEMGDEGQTLEEFLAMEGIEPNEEGTGRISFRDVKKIECLHIKKSNTKNNNRAVFHAIAEITSTFLNIPT